MKKLAFLILFFAITLVLFSCKNCQTCTKGSDEETLCANDYPNSDQFYLAISWQEYLGYTCTKK